MSGIGVGKRVPTQMQTNHTHTHTIKSDQVLVEKVLDSVCHAPVRVVPVHEKEAPKETKSRNRVVTAQRERERERERACVYVCEREGELQMHSKCWWAEQKQPMRTDTKQGKQGHTSFVLLACPPSP